MKRATLSRSICLVSFVVSIHALVKRATWDIGFRNAVLQVSIHALVKRATVMGGMSEYAMLFQSTPS